MLQINLLSGREGGAKKAPREAAATAAAAPISGEGSNAIVMVAGVVLVLGLIGLVAWGYLLNSHKKQLARTLDEKRRELKTYEGLIEQEKRFRAQKELLELKKNTIIRLKDNQAGPVKMLEDIFNRCPDSVWFESIEQKGEQVTIKGRAKNTEAANQFYQELAQSPMIRNIEYPLLRKDEKYRIPNVVFFEILFRVGKAAEEAQAAGS